MALSANTVFEVRTTGSDTNGGGFVTGASGTDWSQQDSPQYSVTDAVANGTSTVTSATAAFGTDVVGNIAYINGGWYQITSRTNSTTIVVDRTISTASGLTLKIGGALLTIATAEGQMVAGNSCWVKSGTYTISSSINFDAGNTLPNGTPSYMIGYDATRGDTPTGTGRPLISSTTGALNPMVRVNVGPRYFMNFRLDGNDNAVTGIQCGDSNYIRGANVINCKVERCTTRGINGNSAGWWGAIIGCEVTDLTAGATAGIEYGACVACYVHDSPGTGFLNPISVVGCVADGMGGDGAKVGALNQPAQVLNCVFAYNTGDGLDATDTYKALCQIANNVFVGNGGYGMRTDQTQQVATPWIIDYNAFYNNTSGARLGFLAGPNDITLSADPFTDGANGDFSLNATAGGGAALAGVGFPATFPVHT